MRMLRTPPFFPLNRRKIPYLEVLSRFGLWRDFLNNNDNIKATISVFRLVKNMSINAKSVEFHQCHAKPHLICFLPQYQRYNEINLCQDLLTIENNNSDLKVHALHYANELLVRVRLSFQKLLQTHSTWRNNTKTCLRVQTTINHISILTFLCFLPQYQRQRKCVFFFRTEKGIARHIDASSVVWPFLHRVYKASRTFLFASTHFTYFVQLQNLFIFVASSEPQRQDIYNRSAKKALFFFFNFYD